MAFNLKAILTLEDRMSGRLRQISNQMSSLNRMTTGAGSSVSNLTSHLSRANSMAGTFRGSIGGATTALGRVSTAATRASSSFSSVSRGGNLFTRGLSSMAGGIGSAISSVMSLNGALLGLGSAYAVVNSAKSVFTATVGNAMEREQSGVVIDAMFNDKKASTAYKKMVEQYAIDSPSMESKQMFGQSKSFIAMTKNVDELEGLWSIVERLAATDPAQGVEGAVFAMREMLSGDAISMARRFELPKAQLNEIKKLDVAGQIAAMDQLLEGMGISQHLIDEMANTALGKWMKVKEQWSLILAEMGKPALEPISNFFDNLLERFNSEDFQRWGNIGGKIIQNIVEGLTNSAIRLYDWFTALTTSPEFQKRTTLSGKVIFFIEDIYERFTTWMNEKGRGLLSKAMEEFLQVGSIALLASQGVIVEAATTIGVAIGKSLVSAASKEFQGWFDGMMENLPGILKMNPASIGYSIVDALKGNESSKAKNQKAIDATLKAQKGTPAPQSTGKAIKLNRSGITPSRNGGLDFIPYDGATYSLHRGEAILTRGEANEWRKGGNKQPTVIAPRREVSNTFKFGDIHLHEVGVDLEKAADKFMDILAVKLQLAGEGGA